MLLMRNSGFPENFNFMEAPQEIMNFAEFSKNFHTSIIVNDYQNVVDQLNENVNLQYCYEIDNISALGQMKDILLIVKDFFVSKYFLIKNFEYKIKIKPL